jgi:hypothetical protein
MGMVIIGAVVFIVIVLIVLQTSGLDNPVSEVAKLESAFKQAAKPFELLKYKLASASNKRNIIAGWASLNPASVSKIYSNFEKIGDELSSLKK